MSDGKKLVTVLDTESCQRLQKPVDEKRYHEIAAGLEGSSALRALKANDCWRSAQDATEGAAFLVSQLAYTEAETYAREYQETQFKDVIPVTSEAGPEASTVRYQIYDKVGQGRRIHSAAKDMPYADVGASQVEVAVVTGGIGYRYDQIELLQAARMIRPLPIERMQTAVEGAERHLNYVAMLGERTDVSGDAKFEGLLNQSAITPTYNNTAGFTAAWATGGTAFDTILADVNKLIYNYWAASNFTLFPDTFGMAPKCFSPLATRYNSLGTKTLIQLLQESNIATARTGKPLNIFPIYLADTAGQTSTGTTGKTRNVLYNNNKKRVVFHVPMVHRFLAPQPEGLDVAVPGMYRYSGVNVRYLYSVAYSDNMDA